MEPIVFVLMFGALSQYVWTDGNQNIFSHALAFSLGIVLGKVGLFIVQYVIKEVNSGKNIH